jgi:hypothetical protein
MSTARDFIYLALKEAGVLGVGQTPLNEDVNDALKLLNNMLAQWQKRRWLVPALTEVVSLGNNQKSNLIGPGQYYNAPRPDKIQAAYFVQLTGNPSDDPVSFPLAPIWSYEDYALIALKKLNSWPQYFFYDNAFPYGNVHIWPVPSQQYEMHLIVKSPIGFTIEIEAGEITNAGVGYTDGAYIGVPLLNLTGFGSGATADITIAGGIITDTVINDAGDGYNINDKLYINPADVGGTGTGFIWTVTEVTSSLDAEFNMPPEYEEAIHYNLCVRLCSMYQYPTNPTQVELAKIALNTIKRSNVQVPTLRMPAPLRFHRANSFYIFNADAR